MSFDAIPQLSIVNVVDLRLRAYIGFMEWETKKLQDVVISFSFKYDTRLASETDSVEHAVNYKEITKTVIEMVDNKSFNLIEHLAELIYDYILHFSPKIQDIHVKVEKPYALRFSDNVMVCIEGEDRYNTAMIALGSNINPEENIKMALKMLQNLGFITKRTEFITTKPLKFEQQADFRNGAVLLLTKKPISELRLILRQIEANLGRVRSENKNAPRTIDLDITTYNGFLIDQEIKELPFLLDFLHFLQPEIKI